jgi:hypothetical protein
MLSNLERELSHKVPSTANRLREGSAAGSPFSPLCNIGSSWPSLFLHDNAQEGSTTWNRICNWIKSESRADAENTAVFSNFIDGKIIECDTEISFCGGHSGLGIGEGGTGKSVVQWHRHLVAYRYSMQNISLDQCTITEDIPSYFSLNLEFYRVRCTNLAPCKPVHPDCIPVEHERLRESSSSVYTSLQKVSRIVTPCIWNKQ